MHKVPCVSVFLFVSLCLVCLVRGQTGADALQLRTDMFTSYDKKVRPVNNQSQAIDVYINFYLLAVNGLDAVTEVLKTTGYLWINWNDDFLNWDPAAYGGIDYYHWPQDDVWKPDIALMNSYKDYKQLGVSTLNVEVDNNGSINWYPFQVFESTCSMDIKFFPFDEQTCEIKMVAWSYSKIEVIIFSGEKGIVLDEYEANSAWDVLDTGWRIDEESGESSISFTLKLKRKPLYVLLSVVLPITLLAVLNIFTFLLPSDGGEKAGYAITVFLALAVFLTIVSATLPENSESVAVFSIYLIIQTVQSTVITLIALVMIRVSAFDKEETPIPKIMVCAVKLSRCVYCRKGFKNNKVRDIKEDNDDAEVQEKPKIDEVIENDDELEWKHVMSAFDVIFFVIFSAIYIISTIVCFVVASVG